MKNLLTTVLAVFLLSFASYGQKIKVTGGVNLMRINFNVDNSLTDNPTDSPTDIPTKAGMKSLKKNIIIDQLKGSTNETGIYIGLALADLSLTESLEIQPEIRFVAVKDYNQIQTPILLKYNLSENFNISAGPSLGFLLDTPEGINSFNFALDFGVSYNISEKFSIESRYDWGQTNLLDGGDSDNYLKLNSFQVGVAYKFGSKK